jgi:putative nucleotidyltransferase with HDIG domain
MPLKVIAATTLVAVVPAAAVWVLRAAGIVGAFLPCAALGALFSLIACSVAAWVWERSDRSGDVLFGDLMIWGWIRRCHQQRRLADASSLLGARRVDGATDPLSLSIERRTQLLEQLAADLEARDPYTHGHSRRVARYATMIAKRMGLSADEVARIRLAAVLHDVGKVETPLKVLHKPGRLTDSEFAVVKEHPVTGERMVAILEDPELSEIVRHHHERLDGTGYPDRLAGDQIPLGSRIISVADTFDAITSERPYRGARPHRQALSILRTEAGAQLDGDAVTAFCSVYLGRRPLSAWVALTDLGERLIATLAPDAIGSTARVVALAASAAAVGGGFAALPAAGHQTGTSARNTRVAAASYATRTTHTAKLVAGTLAMGTRHGGAGASAKRAVGRRGGAVSNTFSSAARRHTGVHQLTGTPASSRVTGTPSGAPGSGPSTSSGSSSSGTSSAASDGSNGSGSSPVPVPTPASASTGLPAPSVGVSAGSSGPGSASVGVTANTGVGPSVGVGVTLGGSGAGVNVTLPGVGGLNLGLGGG